MDLKHRFIALGLDESVVIRLLPILNPEEAASLYDSSDEVLKDQIPLLLERLVDRPKDGELDLSKIGLIKPGGDTVKSTIPPTPVILNEQSPPVGIPQLVKQDDSSSDRLKPIIKVLVFLLLTAGLTMVLMGIKNKPKATLASEGNSETEIINKVQNRPQPNGTALKKTELPIPPDFRATWMFMPWDNYSPAILCDDGRFKDLNKDFTVQFWLKTTQKFQDTVTLLSFISNKQVAESVFINKEGYLCFSPGQDLKNIALMKPLPNNGQHFHIAITRDAEKYTLFVNGKKRQSIDTIDENEEKIRDYIILMKSNSTLKGLAIDELMISDEILFEKDFKPERILTMSTSTVLYMPFEKNKNNLMKCYGYKHYKEHLFAGGKWLNVLNEVQQVINHLELLEEVKGQQSSQSVP